MNKEVTIINTYINEKVRVLIHSEDSMNLIRLLTDVGFISYDTDDSVYDTNDYKEYENA